MELCISLFGVPDLFEGDPSSLLRVAQLADSLGIDQVNVTDHVLMGRRTDRYPYGEFPVPLTYPWYEPITLLAAIAGTTQHIRLATGIIIAPLRPAILFAKQVATLDVLSGGRVDLGVGVGWQPEEYDAAGIPFDERWSRLDDTLRAARTLWEGTETAFTSRSTSFKDVTSAPPPRQPRLPVWFGVKATVRQARRIAELGDGWIPITRDSHAIAEGAALVREAFVARGRHPRELGVRAKLPAISMPKGPRLWEATLNAAPASLAAGVDVLDFALTQYVGKPDQIEPFLNHLAGWRDQL